MFNIRLAGLCIGIDNKYAFVRRLCKKYIEDSPGDEHPAFTVSCTTEELLREAWGKNSDGACALAESVCVYRKICNQMLYFGGFVLHASVVVLNGQAIAFLAPSGVGKTTHTALWLKHFGSRAYVINGDKPILRKKNGVWNVCGTPWCGKEGMNRNTEAPLAALCFLDRSDRNSIRPATSDEIIDRMFEQILIPKDAKRMNLLIDYLNDVLEQAGAYYLECTPDDEAATVAYSGLASYIGLSGEGAMS